MKKHSKGPAEEAFRTIRQNGLWMFGLWAPQVWASWAIGRSPAIPSLWVILYYSLSLALVTAAILFYKKQKQANAPLWLDVAMTILMTLATAWMGWASAAAFPLALTGATALGAIGLGWCYLRWSSYYSRISLQDALVCIAGAIVIGSLIKVVLSFLPADFRTAFAVCLPFFSLLMSKHARANIPPTSTDPPLRFCPDNVIQLWRVIAGVGAYSLVIGFLTNAATEPSSRLASVGTHVIEIGVSLLLVYWVVLKQRNLRFPQIWKTVMLFLSTAILLLLIFGPTAESVAMPVVGLSQTLTVMVLWLALSDIARHSTLHPWVVFGAGWTAYAFPLALGSQISQAAYAYSGRTAMLAVIAYIASLAMAYLIDAQGELPQRIFSDLRRTVVPDDYSLIDERCERLGKANGLTKREIEITQQLSKGKSKSSVAEALFITENTVRDHTRHIYSKLHIHSKHELQDLLHI